MKTKKLFIIFFLFVGLGLVAFKGGKIVGATVMKSFKGESANIEKIQAILEDHCNCERIEKDIYTKGVQYNGDEGFTTEKINFIMTNCQYENLKEEGETITKKLNEKGFKTFNLITLEFISDEKQETISIKNGKTQ